MADAPEGIVLRRHRDLQGRRHQVWVRRAIIAIIAVVPLLGLANVFGQRAVSTEATGAQASLSVNAPVRLRGGLIYEAHLIIRARSDLPKAALILHPDWLSGMTLNTLEPSPESETSENGALRFDLGEIKAGKRFDLVLQYQVNPTAIGRRKQWIDLVDGQAMIASVRRDLFIFP
jgi:hypothetical protein